RPARGRLSYCRPGNEALTVLILRPNDRPSGAVHDDLLQMSGIRSTANAAWASGSEALQSLGALGASKSTRPMSEAPMLLSLQPQLGSVRLASGPQSVSRICVN